MTRLLPISGREYTTEERKRAQRISQYLSDTKRLDETKQDWSRDVLDLTDDYLVSLSDIADWDDDEPIPFEAVIPEEALTDVVIQVAEKDIRERLRAILFGLDKRDFALVCLRYGVGGNGEHTLMQTGQALGITPERVRQIEIRIFRKFRYSKPFRALLQEAR